MKKTFTFLAAMAAATFSMAQTYSTGSVVVLRVGDGASGLLNTGAPVFLDEYSPVQPNIKISTVALPTSASGANKRLILGGTSTTEGMLQLSSNGYYLTVCGYDTSLGGRALGNTTTATVARSVAFVNHSQEVDLTTGLTDFASGNSPRGVVSSDGQKFWVSGGSSGIRYGVRGASTSVRVNTADPAKGAAIQNFRALNIAGGKLYFTTSSGSAIRVGVVDTAGLAQDTGNVIISVPGVPGNTNPNQFVFLDLDASVPGPDVLYVADETLGIQKYSLVNNSWVLNGNYGAVDRYRGITAISGILGVGIVATRKGGSAATGGGELVSLRDITGYNGAFAISDSFLLATAPANTAYRGVAFAPSEVPLPLSLLSFTASKTNNGTLLVWTTNKEFSALSYELQKSVDGSPYKTISTQKANGDELYNEYNTTDKESNTGIAYYRLKMVDKNGDIKYSNILKMANLAAGKFTISPNPADGFINIGHGLVKGKAIVRIVTMDGRQMAAYPVPDGSYQTSLNIASIQAGVYRVVFENGGNKTSSLIIKK